MILQFENFSYVYDKGLLKKDSETIELTKIQKKLLNFFIDNPHRIFSKQELMENVWKRIVTDNSVDQVIYILRNHIETNPSKPTIFVTRYGQGISFEAEEKESVEKTDQVAKTSKQKSTQNNFSKLILLALVFLVVSIFSYQYFSKKQPVTVDDKPQQLLVMPMTFTDKAIATTQQQGMSKLLITSFQNLDDEGLILFEETLQNTQQAIKKHKQLEKSLVVIQSQVEKVGNIYNSYVEMNNGKRVIKRTKLSANNLNDLINSQIELIANYQNKISTNHYLPIINKTPDEKYIEALGLFANGDYSKAKELFEEVLSQQEDNYNARFSLATILLKQKQYDKSLAQLETLKATEAYDSIGTEIELAIADINLVKSNYTQIIDGLKEFQLSHPDISEVKKARIKIIIAHAYHAIGDAPTALTFYKNALVRIDEHLNPKIFAQSYYGQGMLEITQSNGDEVYQLFEKSFEDAKAANDVHQQVLSLNKMAKILHYRLEWDKAIALQKQALALLELEKDQRSAAILLSTLIPILQQQGYKKDAFEKIEKFGRIGEDLNSDLIRLHYLHFISEVQMDRVEFEKARETINQHLRLATETKNYAMVLDNAFLEFELRLTENDLTNFKQEWDKRGLLIKEKGFERFQVYMDLYLARYYKQTNNDNKAIAQLNKVTELTKASKDYNFLVEAHNYLAEIYLKTDAQKALEILNNLEQYNPQPNPYLYIKAQVLAKLGKKIDALNLMNQAKLSFHDNWDMEQQNFMDSLKVTLK
jgi:DNA-binding winged helix-turn-helix (wHTH) protein